MRLSGYARFFARKLVVGSTLALIGLIVGIGCGLLPLGVPLGIVALAALLLLWVMPDLRSVPKAWTSAMLVPFTIVFLCVPNFFGLILPGLPWISIRRAFLFAWIIPFAIVLAGSSEQRRFIHESLIRSRAVWTSILGFLLILVLSTITSLAPIASLVFNINFVLSCFAPLLAVVFVIRTAETLLTLFRIAIMAVGIDLVIGAIEFHAQKPFLLNLLPGWMRDQILTANPTAALTLVIGAAMRGGMYRASSIYTTPLSWGEVSAMIMPMSLHFVGHGKSLSERCYGAFGMMMCFLSVMLSGSRGAYVGMIAATIAFSFVWSLRSWRQHPGRLVGAIWLTLYCVSTTAVVFVVMFVGRVRKVVLGGSEVQGSTDARADQWALAQPKILERPFLGYGATTAGDVIHYVLPGGFITVDGYHMTLLVEYGVPGFLLFFAIFVFAAGTSFNTYVRSNSSESQVGAALGAGMLAFILYRFTLSQTDSLPFAFMMVGFAIAYRRIAMPQPLRQTYKAPPGPVALQVGS